MGNDFENNMLSELSDLYQHIYFSFHIGYIILFYLYIFNLVTSAVC